MINFLDDCAILKRVINYYIELNSCTFYFFFLYKINIFNVANSFLFLAPLFHHMNLENSKTHKLIVSNINEMLNILE